MIKDFDLMYHFVTSITHKDKYNLKGTCIYLTKKQLIKQYINKKHTCITLDDDRVKLNKNKTDFSKVWSINMPVDQKKEFNDFLRNHKKYKKAFRDEDQSVIEELVTDVIKSIKINFRVDYIFTCELTEKQFDFLAYWHCLKNGSNIAKIDSNFVKQGHDFWFLYLNTQYIRCKKIKKIEEAFPKEKHFKYSCNNAGVLDNKHCTKTEYYWFMDYVKKPFSKVILNQNYKTK